MIKIEAISEALQQEPPVSEPKYAVHWIRVETLPSILEHGLISPLEANRRGISVQYSTSAENPEIGLMTTPYSSYAERSEVGVIVPFPEQYEQVGPRKYFTRKSFDPDEILALVVLDRKLNTGEIFGDDYTSASFIGARDVSELVGRVNKVLRDMNKKNIPIFGTSGEIYSSNS